MDASPIQKTHLIPHMFWLAQFDFQRDNKKNFEPTNLLGLKRRDYNNLSKSKGFSVYLSIAFYRKVNITLPLEMFKHKYTELYIFL